MYKNYIYSSPKIVKAMFRKDFLLFSNILESHHFFWRKRNGVPKKTCACFTSRKTHARSFITSLRLVSLALQEIVMLIYKSEPFCLIATINVA